MPPYLDDTANTDPCFMMALPVSLPGHGGGRVLPMLPGNETRCLLASLPDHMGGEKALPTWPGNRATGVGVPVLIFSWRKNRDVFCSDCPLTEVPLQKLLQRKEFVYLSTYKLLWLEHSSVTYLQ